MPSGATTLAKAGLAHRDRIDIAFDDDDLAAVVRGLSRPMVVEEQRALVEERGLGGVEIFRLRARLHRPAAEGHDPARAIVDRKHHPVAKPVVRDGDPFAVNEQARLDHLLGADALGRERVAQGKALGRGEAQRKALLRGRAEAAIGEIAARLRSDRPMEIAFEQARRHRQHVDEARALFLLLCLGAALLRHRDARHRRQPLDSVREAQALGLDDES